MPDYSEEPNLLYVHESTIPYVFQVTGWSSDHVEYLSAKEQLIVEWALKMDYIEHTRIKPTVLIGV